MGTEAQALAPPQPAVVPKLVHHISSARPAGPQPVVTESLAAFTSEDDLVARQDRSKRPTEGASPSPSVAGFNWKRVGIIVLAVVALAQAGLIIAWWQSGGRLFLGNGSIVITSTPPGAPVFIDEAAKGVTPITATLAPGIHTLRVGEGASARTQPFEVERGGTATLHLDIAPAQSAAPAVPAPSVGGLHIVTEPAGGRVSVDGQARGPAPLTLSDIQVGTHEVLVESASGTVRRTVTVNAGSVSSLVISTASNGIASGWLALSSPVPARILENGTQLGSTDTPRILLPAGRHQLEFVNDELGYRAERTVQVSPGQTATVQLEAVRGTISINAQPWAEVTVDGQRVGETPIGNLSLPIGRHELVFRHPQLGERRQTVTVAVGVPARVGVDLRR